MKFLSTLIFAALLISCAQDNSKSTNEPPATEPPSVKESENTGPLGAGIHSIDSFHNLLVLDNGESIVLPKKLLATATLDMKYLDQDNWIELDTSSFESLKYTCLNLTQEFDPLALVLRKNTPIIEGKSAHEYDKAKSAFSKLLKYSARWRLHDIKIQFESNEYALQLLLAHSMYQRVKGVRALGIQDISSYHELLAFSEDSLQFSFYPRYTDEYTNLEYLNHLAICDLVFNRIRIEIKKDNHAVPIELKIQGQ